MSYVCKFLMMFAKTPKRINNQPQEIFCWWQFRFWVCCVCVWRHKSLSRCSKIKHCNHIMFVCFVTADMAGSRRAFGLCMFFYHLFLFSFFRVITEIFLQLPCNCHHQLKNTGRLLLYPTYLFSMALEINKPALLLRVAQDSVCLCYMPSDVL
jgi:hypothetical protein